MDANCDIDVLVHERDAEKTKSVLVDEYDYVYHRKGSHDILLFSPTNVHIELYYDFVEDECANETLEALKSVWNVSAVRDKYGLEMNGTTWFLNKWRIIFCTAACTETTKTA